MFLPNNLTGSFDGCLLLESTHALESSLASPAMAPTSVLEVFSVAMQDFITKFLPRQPTQNTGAIIIFLCPLLQNLSVIVQQLGMKRSLTTPIFMNCA